MFFGEWFQDIMIEKIFIIKDTLFVVRKFFSLFLLGLGLILGYGLFGIIQGREEKLVIQLERVSGENCQKGGCGY